MNINMKESPRRQHVFPGAAIVQMNQDRRYQAFTARRRVEAVPSSLKGRDEDLALIDRFLMPMAIVTCLLGMGSALLICFLIW